MTGPRPRSSRRLGVVLVAAALSAAARAGQSRCSLATFELDGPLERVTLDLGAWGATEVRAGLLAGEHVEVSLPLPLPLPSGRPGAVVQPTPTDLWPAGGRARFAGWDSAPREGEGSGRIPPGLAARARTNWGPREVGPGWFERLALAALFAGILALRKRPVASLLAGCLGASVLVLAAERRPASATRRVYEVELPGGAALSVDTARDALELGPRAPTALEVEPPGVALRFVVELAHGRWSTWRVEARGAVLHAVRMLEPGLAGTFAERNDFATLEPCYERAPLGGWSSLGSWARGDPRPSAGTAAEVAPPGPLNPALPFGVRVLLGRVADLAELPAALDPRPAEAWVRAIGGP